MAKVSFVKSDAPGAAPVEQVSETVSTPAPDVTVECQTTVAPGAAISVPATVTKTNLPERVANPFDFDDDCIELADVNIPKINFVQKVGPMSTIWTPGEIVLNQQTPIFTPKIKDTPATEPLNVIVIGINRKDKFVEKVEGGAMGDILDSEEEVKAANGTLDWEEHRVLKSLNKPVKLFERMATGWLFIEQPAHVKDDDHLIFTQEFNGKFYVLAKWTMKGRAYTNGAKKLRTAKKFGELIQGWMSCTYKLHSELSQSKNGNFSYIPVLKPVGKTSPELVSYIKTLMGLQ